MTRTQHNADDRARPGITGRASGMSLIEVVIVAAVFPVLVYAALSLVQSGQNLDRTVREKAVMMDKLRVTMRRMADELRASSRTAEDRNGNGTLDAGEDTNGNGRFEDDWLVSTNSIRFNRLNANGTYDLPVTYRLEGTDLLRDYFTSPTDMHTVSVASNIAAFTVTLPSDETVTIAMTVQVAQPGGAVDTESTTMTIQQRN